MKHSEPVYYIFDFDSTFIQVETLDCLAERVLRGHPARDQILTDIESYTRKAMNGELSYYESLRARMRSLFATQTDFQELISFLKRKITPSIRRSKSFFQENKDHIYIVSAGFREVIWPVVQSYGIVLHHVFANQLLFDFHGNLMGFDEKNVLAQDDGKTRLIRSLKLKGNVVVVGDGYTDYKVKADGAAHQFIAFTENIHRDPVVDKADAVAASMQEFFKICGLEKYQEKKARSALLLEKIHPQAIQNFEDHGFEVEVLDEALEEKELIRRVKNISYLGIRSKTVISKKVLQAASHLEAIGAFCIGTNQVDLEACSDHGIAVFNAPYSNTRSVVELAIGEIIMLARKVFDKSQALHQGEWQKSSKDCHEVRGKKLGIVGYGNIGSQLSVLAESLGLEVLYFDEMERLPLGNAKKCHSLYALLSQVDIVSIHVDGNLKNRNLIDGAAFQHMKQGILFLNLSRGFVVDLAALVQAIKTGVVAGVAIDVFPSEPKMEGERLQNELQGLPNVILTPHVGGSTEEAQEHIGDFVSARMVEFEKKGTSLGSVNFPHLQLPELHDVHRIIHIHRNKPGILANLNQQFAKHQGNIEGQYLKTHNDIGVVITDVRGGYNPEMLQALKAIPETIKVRVIY